MLQDFKAFLTKSNALALAVGVIIGAAIGKVVSGGVDDFLMPVIGLALPAGDWREAKLVLRTVTEAKGKVTDSAIAYGHLIGTFINFFLIALVVFLVTKALIKPAPTAPTRKCPECLEAIPSRHESARRAGRQALPSFDPLLQSFPEKCTWNGDVSAFQVHFFLTLELIR